VNAGCKGGVLVETATTDEKVKSINAVYSAPNLTDAVKFIVAN